MLNFAEEILLLTLDDNRGAFYPMPESAMRTALAGALLMELAVADRIDTDMHSLMVVNTEPVGDALIDVILERLKAEPAGRNTSEWLGEIALQEKDLKEKVLQRLVDKKVLKVEEHKILWVFARRRYPLMDDKEIKEVRTRLRDLVYSNDIPDAREAVLVGLVNACALVDTVFEEHELPQVMPRFTELAKLDLIGREVDQAIREIFLAMTSHLFR
ncbi:GPP34 family phosphoprotein [Desulfonatronospira sp.]|uniref:GOLPH3/VPS74 family protein n=1 Tax=Desulfonatronospira sp. TaxID=1962951 RepID=UPI0025BB4B30|nr:GPP34 family phosphoprotein [Desulfonatronospira sp.]